MAPFSSEFLTFLGALERHNDREWFHANKSRYENAVKDPFHDFVEEMIHRIGAIDPAVRIQPKDAIFRIHRDIRFSKDKTPYKTFVSAVVSPGGRKDHERPGLYFQFGAKSMAVAGGLYQPGKEQLYNIRIAIRERGHALTKLLAAKAFTTLFGELQGEKNKVLPKEFKPAQDQHPIIAHKQFYFWAEYPARTVLRPDLGSFLVKHYKAGKRVSDWLAAAAAG